MTTLIICKPTDGTATRRCDARCYNAKGPKCNCICEGMNHGKGFNIAIRNTSLNAEITHAAHAAMEILFPHIQYPLFSGGKL